MPEFKYDHDPNKKFFENIEYDSDDRYLVMHHESAGRYYKLNFLFLLSFFGMSFMTYKNNSAVFWNEKIGKIYLGVICTGMLSVWLFANKHIHQLYLLKNKNVGIITYSNFGVTYNRMHEIPISQFKGSRLLWSQGMNLYYLEYNKLGKLT